MSRPPEPTGPAGDSLVPRRLSNEQFEVVIRRAAELQARAAESGDDGMSEAEAVRIGRELGLSGAHLSQALAEVRGGETGERGLLDRMVGVAAAQATRVVPGEAAAVAARLERYLVEHEYYTVLRRYPDRVAYEPAPGAVAAVSRSLSRAFGRTPVLGMRNVEAGVVPLEDGFCHVTLRTRLESERMEHLGWGIVGGGGAGALVATALGIAVDPAAALIGVPVWGSALAGMRWTYVRALDRAQVRLEALLDRLEHGDLPQGPPPKRDGRGWR